MANLAELDLFFHKPLPAIDKLQVALAIRETAEDAKGIAVTKNNLAQAHLQLGNLDQATGQKISDLLFSLNQQSDTTLVLVTHEPRLAERCQSIITIDDGRLVSHTGV